MSTSPPRVAVVGAGVVGLSTAVALLDAGAIVRLYERDQPGRGMSNGRTRVFRLAHGDPAMVELAARAERLWREWEARFRRRLVGNEGLVITGDETVAAWTGAMATAGAPHQVLSIAEASARIPIARLTGSSALFDPAAGPTRARRTIECLQAVCAGILIGEEVQEIQRTPGGCVVVSSQGRWECDEVILATGVDTERLAAPLGVGHPTRAVPDSRFTFVIREPYRAHSLPCWFDTGGPHGPGHTSYGQRVGSTDRYAVAVAYDSSEKFTPDEEAAHHRRVAEAYIPQAYPGLEPEIVDEIRCIYPISGIRPDGDGFMGRRQGGVTALYGTNLFKFAPLLGQLLAQSALHGALPEELTALAVG